MRVRGHAEMINEHLDFGTWHLAGISIPALDKLTATAGHRNSASREKHRVTHPDSRCYIHLS
jgi:hypothetical protein